MSRMTGRFGRHIHGLGHNVEMLAGMERHVDARHQADFARPHAGAIDHIVGGDIALVRLHADGAAVLDDDAGDLQSSTMRGAAGMRAPLASAIVVSAGLRLPVLRGTRWRR